MTSLNLSLSGLLYIRATMRMEVKGSLSALLPSVGVRIGKVFPCKFLWVGGQKNTAAIQPNVAASRKTFIKTCSVTDLAMLFSVLAEAGSVCKPPVGPIRRLPPFRVSVSMFARQEQHFPSPSPEMAEVATSIV